MPNGLIKLKSVQAEVHPYCLVCSSANPYGLALTFETAPDGVLSSTFHPNPVLEGYEGLLHGGVIASLLDGIMTNCLFAQGIVAVTAELNVRYQAPVLVGPEIQLKSWIENRYSPLFLLRAELRQDHCVKAIASAKFMERHE